MTKNTRRGSCLHNVFQVVSCDAGTQSESGPVGHSLIRLWTQNGRSVYSMTKRHHIHKSCCKINSCIRCRSHTLCFREFGWAAFLNFPAEGTATLSQHRSVVVLIKTLSNHTLTLDTETCRTLDASTGGYAAHRWLILSLSVRTAVITVIP